MSVPFEIPDWLIDNTSPAQAPPDTADVDPHRVEDLVNRFIAGKQEALFTAPDAYYRTTGADAVDGAPGILYRLNDLRTATLDAAGDDGTRFMLGPRLDAHLDDAGDGIDRHVTAQRDELTRQIISERQTLIQRAAQLEHNNDDKLAGLAEAHASAAQELARMNGEPEAAATDAARSAIWRAAIDQRLTNGNRPQALALFDRVQGQLGPDEHLSLDGPLQAARSDHAADQWIASQTGTDGPPLQERAAADPSLPSDAKLIVRAKLDAHDSAQESRRVAAVKALDDQIADVTRTLATTPGAYKTGTLFQIARAYDDAGEPDKAAITRRLAKQEAVLVPFARMSVDKQQRLIDSLPDGELRDTAVAIQHHQADAFAHDPFAAGTMLYDEVGPPVPIDDIQGRFRQARQIAQIRGTLVAPFTAEERADIDRQRTRPSSQEEPEVISDASDDGAAFYRDGVQLANSRQSSGSSRGGRIPATPLEETRAPFYEAKIEALRRIEPNNQLVKARLEPAGSPITREQNDMLDRELAEARAREAGRELARQAAGRGEKPRVWREEDLLQHGIFDPKLQADLGRQPIISPSTTGARPFSEQRRLDRLPQPKPAPVDEPQPQPVSTLDRTMRDAVDRANYAQTTYGRTFQKGGRLEGWSYNDVVSALGSGRLTPKDVYIDVINRDGHTLVVNSRSSQALLDAGIGRQDWWIRNMTGNPAAEQRLTDQLERDNLTSAGTPTMTPRWEKPENRR